MDRLYSFVLPAYKARFFKESVDSILSQTYTNFELIIVNDASPEDLDSIVKSYDDPRIQYYVNEENIGGGDLVSQWNKCITYAKGDYLILASDDDIYHSDYLRSLDLLVDKYPDVSIFRPRVQSIDAQGNVLVIFGCLNEYVSSLEYAYYREKVSTGIPFYIFKRASLLSIGGFVNYPLAWHSDDATVTKISKSGVVFFNGIEFSFRYSGESISTKKNDYKMLKSKIEAIIRFYKDLPAMLMSLDVKSSQDVVYRDLIIGNIHKARLLEIKSCFECSTKIAAIRCWPFLFRTKYVSIKILIIMYLKHLLLR